MTGAPMNGQADNAAFHVDICALHARLLWGVAAAAPGQNPLESWSQFTLHRQDGATPRPSDGVDGRRSCSRPIWQQLLQRCSHTLSSAPDGSDFQTEGDVRSWKLSSTWLPISACTEQLLSIEAASPALADACCELLPLAEQLEVEARVHRAAVVLLPRTYLQLVGQVLLAAAAVALQELMSWMHDRPEQLRLLLVGLYGHPFAAAVLEAANWSMANTLKPAPAGSSCSSEPLMLSPLLPLPSVAARHTAAARGPSPSGFRRVYRSRSTTTVSSGGAPAAPGSSGGLMSPTGILACLQQVQVDIQDFTRGFLDLVQAAAASATDSPQQQQKLVALAAAVLQEQLAASWQAACPGVVAVMNTVLSREMQVLLQLDAGKTVEEAWRTAVVPPPDLLIPHPLAAPADTAAAAATAGGLQLTSQFPAPFPSACSHTCGGCSATMLPPAAAAAWESGPDTIVASGHLHGASCTCPGCIAQQACPSSAVQAAAAAAVAAGRAAVAGMYASFEDCPGRPQRVAPGTAQLLVLVRCGVLNVVLLPIALRARWLASLLRTLLHCIAALTTQLQESRGELRPPPRWPVMAVSGGAAAAGEPPGPQEGPAATVLVLADVLLLAGVLRPSCWPSPGVLGVCAPQEVTQVELLLAEAREQAAALVAAAAEVLVVDHLDLLVGLVTAGLSHGQARSIPLAAQASATGSGGNGAAAAALPRQLTANCRCSASPSLRLWVLLQQRWETAVLGCLPAALAAELLHAVGVTSTQWVAAALLSSPQPSSQVAADAALFITSTWALDQQLIAARQRATAACTKKNGPATQSSAEGTCTQLSSTCRELWDRRQQATASNSDATAAGAAQAHATGPTSTEPAASAGMNGRAKHKESAGVNCAAATNLSGGVQISSRSCSVSEAPLSSQQCAVNSSQQLQHRQQVLEQGRPGTAAAANSWGWMPQELQLLRQHPYWQLPAPKPAGSLPALPLQLPP